MTSASNGGPFRGAQAQKLLVVITSDVEADALIHKLVERGYPATKVSSSGGFLRRGSATILSGVEAADVEQVLRIVRTECRARTERVPVSALPFPQGVVQEPAEVRVGGAIVFVLPVEHFEKT
jgi:uncharacterized protein YaaQ